MNTPDLIPEVVPVEKEPIHQELYNSPYVRLYKVTLRPGEETAYHSHCEDTLYVVLKGGRIQTVQNPLDEGCSSRLLKRYGLLYNMGLFFGQRRKKPVFLVDGFTFFMPSKTKKVVHKAIASTDNTHDMVLLGIEIKSPYPIEHSS